MPSTWSAVSCCLFLLTISPALEKAHSDVALDACAHNWRLAKSAIFQRPLPHGLSTIQAHPLNYGPPTSMLHPSPVLAMCEQVYHTQPLTSWGSVIWLASLPSLAANCLSTIGLQPQPPPPLLTLASGSEDDPSQSPHLSVKAIRKAKKWHEHLGCLIM